MHEKWLRNEEVMDLGKFPDFPAKNTISGVLLQIFRRVRVGARRPETNQARGGACYSKKI